MVDIHALAGAYVLDAVDDVERAAFSRHLDGCASCASEVGELLATAARLADGAWSVPPPRLRTEVLAQVARTRQERPGRRPERDGWAARSRWRAVTAVAAAVVATAAVTYAVQEQRLHGERAATVAARVDTERLRAVLGEPDLVVRGVGLPGGGRLTVFSSATRDVGVALLADAPPIPADRAYQLWLMDGDVPRPANVLAAGASGETAVVSGVRGRTAIAVTVEPATGSPQPTTRPLVSVPLS